MQVKCKFGLKLLKLYDIMKKINEVCLMSTDKIDVRGVYFDNVSMGEAVNKCRELFYSDGKPKIIHTPNAEIVQLCIEQPEYYELINGADITIPDGAGVILAAKILKTPLVKGRVPGIELGENLVKLSAELGWKVFLYGGKPGIAEIAAKNMKSKYPELKIAGTCDGFVQNVDEVIGKIHDSGAEFLIVCLGMIRQEKWMRDNIDKLNVKLMGGFGGSIDGYAGIVKRAPKIFLKLNLEWFYRLIREPRRIGRMMKLPKFIFGTMIYKIKNR